MFLLSEHEPAWVVAAADQRLALLREKVKPEFLRGFDIVQTPLTEPPSESEDAFLRWDNSCDHCGKYLPQTLECRMVERKVGEIRVLITVGACQRCWSIA